jgi:hypothetical protein
VGAQKQTTHQETKTKLSSATPNRDKTIHAPWTNSEKAGIRTDFTVLEGGHSAKNEETNKDSKQTNKPTKQYSQRAKQACEKC